MIIYIKRLLNDSRGGILVLTILTLPVIILLTALCVDLGMIYLAKEKSLMAAMSAVEAAAQRYPDIDSAQDLATQVALATLNDTGFLSSYQIDTDFTDTHAVVSVQVETKTILARFADMEFLETGSIIEVPLQ